MDGGGDAELRAFSAIRKVSSNSPAPNHTLFAVRKIILVVQGNDTLAKKELAGLSFDLQAGRDQVGNSKGGVAEIRVRR